MLANHLGLDGRVVTRRDSVAPQLGQCPGDPVWCAILDQIYGFLFSLVFGVALRVTGLGLRFPVVRWDPLQWDIAMADAVADMLPSANFVLSTGSGFQLPLPLVSDSGLMRMESSSPPAPLAALVRPPVSIPDPSSRSVRTRRATTYLNAPIPHGQGAAARPIPLDPPLYPACLPVPPTDTVSSFPTSRGTFRGSSRVDVCHIDSRVLDEFIKCHSALCFVHSSGRVCLNGVSSARADTELGEYIATRDSLRVASSRPYDWASVSPHIALQAAQLGRCGLVSLKARVMWIWDKIAHGRNVSKFAADSAECPLCGLEDDQRHVVFCRHPVICQARSDSLTDIRKQLMAPSVGKPMRSASSHGPPVVPPTEKVLPKQILQFGVFLLQLAEEHGHVQSDTLSQGMLSPAMVRSVDVWVSYHDRLLRPRFQRTLVKVVALLQECGISLWRLRFRTMAQIAAQPLASAARTRVLVSLQSEEVRSEYRSLGVSAPPLRQRHLTQYYGYVVSSQEAGGARRRPVVSLSPCSPMLAVRLSSPPGSRPGSPPPAPAGIG